VIIEIGDTVRHSIDFIKALGPHAAEHPTGTVTALRGSARQVAKVAWNDGTITSCLLRNLEKYPPVYPPSPWATPSQEDIAIERGMLLAKALR
jgi:hypothetical protein